MVFDWNIFQVNSNSIADKSYTCNENMVPFLGDFSYNRSKRKMIERGGRGVKIKIR
jgi:hypothetical protein